MAIQIPNGVKAVKVSSLNCIGLSSSDIHQSVSLLKQACLHCGFFYVVNRGISEQFMDEVFAQSRRLFSLLLSGEMKLLRNKNYRGYTPSLHEYLDHENQVNGDYEEGYYIGVELAGDDLDTKKPFYGPNVWPAPEMLGEAIATLRLLHYEGQISDPLNGIFGAGAHYDFGLITLLATDDVVGLQICTDKNAKPQIWEYVPPIKGLVILPIEGDR